MSKKLILCVVLAFMLILVGTGYAYWTDTLNVTTKATTGDLDVTFVDLGAYAQYTNEYDESNWSIIDGIGQTGYVPANFFERGTNTYNDVFGNPDQRAAYYTRATGFNSVTMDAELQDSGQPLGQNYPGYPYGSAHNAGDTVSIVLTELYPGYAQAFRSDIINIGSIAAKLSKLNFSLKNVDNVPNSSEINNMIGVALLVEDENPEIHGQIAKLASQFTAAEKFKLGGVEFVRLEALRNKSVSVADNYILVPTQGKEHRADMFIGIAVDPDAEGVYTTGSADVMANKTDANSQNKGVQVDIQFVWDQFNVGNDPKTTNRLELQNGTTTN